MVGKELLVTDEVGLVEKMLGTIILERTLGNYPHFYMLKKSNDLLGYRLWFGSSDWAPMVPDGGYGAPGH